MNRVNHRQKRRLQPVVEKGNPSRDIQNLPDPEASDPDSESASQVATRSRNLSNTASCCESTSIIWKCYILHFSALLVILEVES